MARPSKLTEKQWAEIERRVPPSGTESMRSVAKEFNVSEGVIRKRVKTHLKPINALANQLAMAEMAIEKLPISTQCKVRSLADSLKGISESLANSAELSAKTSHRLSALANSEAQKIDDAEPMKSESILRGVAALTRMSNDAAAIPLGLMSANKEMLKEQPTDNLKPMTLEEFYANTESGT